MELQPVSLGVTSDGAVNLTLTDEDIEALNRDRFQREENEKEQAERIFRENLVPATQSICNLALYAASSRIKLQAAQYVVERIMGRVQDNPPEPPRDPFKDLLAEVSVNLTEDEWESLRKVAADPDSEDSEDSGKAGGRVGGAESNV